MPALPPARRPWLPDAVAVAILAAALLALAVAAGSDASWDLRNYHLYGPFALLHKPPGTDLVPAQLQTFIAPTVDLVPYLLRVRLDAHPALLSAILGLREVAAAFAAYAIGLVLLPLPAGATVPARAMRAALLLLALAIGVTGAGALPVIAGSMGGMPETACLLAALWLFLRHLSASGPVAPPLRPLAAAGLLLGVGIGLKLTILPFAVAAAAAVLLWMPASLPRRAAAALCIALPTAAGALATSGWWWLRLWRQYGNPVFPYYNNLFRAPDFPPVALRDERFLPHGLVDALALPLRWALHDDVQTINELPFRDPRIAIALLAVVLCAAAALLRRRTRAEACFLTFFAAAFALWEAQFAILRYLAPLELLSGLAVLLLLKPLRPAFAVPLLAATLALDLGVTRLPDWGRADPPGHAVAVDRSALPQDGMVLLLTGDPMAYLAASAPPATRFVGINDNIVHPGSTDGLSRTVEAAVRAAIRSPGVALWSLEVPDASSGADAALAFYGLARGPGCRPVPSNLDASTIRLCPLLRAKPPPP